MAAKKRINPIIAIVCTDKKYNIGNKGDLVVHIEEDMKHFARVTTKGFVIMGRKTYESLPKRPLKNRKNIVITRNPTNTVNDIENEDINPVYISLEDVQDWMINKRKDDDREKISVIGGGQIYNELLPYCEMIYITKVLTVEAEEADTKFPVLEDMADKWSLVEASEIKEEKGIKFQYRKYKNKKILKERPVEKPKKEKKTKTKKKE